MGFTIETETTIKKEDIKLEIAENIPVLVTIKAEQRIRALNTISDKNEWMGYLIGKKHKDGSYTIEDIYIPQQTVNGTYCEPTMEGTKETNIPGYIGWIHSHNDMGVFFSEQDWATAVSHPLSVCVNNKYEWFIKALTGPIDCPQSNAHEKKVFVDVSLYHESKHNQEIHEETIAIVKEKISEKTYQQTQTVFNKETENIPNFKWEDYCEELEEELATINSSPETEMRHIYEYFKDNLKGILKEHGIDWKCLSCKNHLGRKKKKVSVCTGCAQIFHKKCMKNENICDECEKEREFQEEQIRLDGYVT